MDVAGVSAAELTGVVEFAGATVTSVEVGDTFTFCTLLCCSTCCSRRETVFWNYTSIIFSCILAASFNVIFPIFITSFISLSDTIITNFEEFDSKKKKTIITTSFSKDFLD